MATMLNDMQQLAGSTHCTYSAQQEAARGRQVNVALQPSRAVHVTPSRAGHTPPVPAMCVLSETSLAEDDCPLGNGTGLLCDHTQPLPIQQQLTCWGMAEPPVRVDSSERISSRAVSPAPCAVKHHTTRCSSATPSEGQD